MQTPSQNINFVWKTLLAVVIFMYLSNAAIASPQDKTNQTNKLISQAHQTFEKGDWHSAMNILIGALAKDPGNPQIKKELSSMYSNLALATYNQDKHSAAAIELAEKALSLDPNNAEAKKLISTGWIGLSSPEYTFSISFPNDAKHDETSNLFGRTDSWLGQTGDRVYQVGATKFNEGTHLITMTASGQQGTLKGLISGFFKSMESSSGGKIESEKLVRQYKLNGYSAEDYLFSIQKRDGITTLDGKSIFCINEHFGYIFTAITRQGKLNPTSSFFASIKIK